MKTNNKSNTHKSAAKTGVRSVGTTAGLAGILLASFTQGAHSLQSLIEECKPGRSFEVVHSETGYGALDNNYDYYIIRTCDNQALDDNYIRKGIDEMKITLDIIDDVPDGSSNIASFGRTFYEKDKTTPYEEFGSLGRLDTSNPDVFGLDLYFKSHSRDQASYTDIFKGDGEIHFAVRYNSEVSEDDENYPARGRISWGREEDGATEKSNRYSLPIFEIESPYSMAAKEYERMYKHLE